MTGSRLPVAIDGLMPGWSSELLGLLDHALPAPANLPVPAPFKAKTSTPRLLMSRTEWFL